MTETEADTRANRIDPVLRAAGWGVAPGSKIRREMICPGRITGGGRVNPLSADYVLSYRDRKLAVIEAKRAGLGHTDGVGQAKDYATRLKARFAYSTNGHGWYGIDMTTGSEGDHALPFPSPQELWNRCFPEGNDWRDRFGAVPFETGGGKWEPRYYQHNAITAVLEAVARGRERILLTLATGTGKTSIAFQIAWKLYHASWNLSRDPVRRPRILFLADRNILADQAYNSFSAFPPDALCRISPDEIRKQGKIPKNANVFFTIFQTFMTGTGELTFQGYPKDFFDFIVIDECHRGGAKDESTWRGILEYFAQHLREFQDNEKTLPTILVTSHKLSTGVDARNIRNIVLLRPIKSMIEFKQIVGRGTRTFDGKDFFTVYDFVKAYEHFNDPEWDGEPLPPDPPGPGPKPPSGPPPEPPEPGGDDEPPNGEKIVVKLADGKDRQIRYIAATTYWSHDGRPITAQEFMEQLFGDLGALVASEDELRQIWSDPERREGFIERLVELGYDSDRMEDMRRLIDAPNSDIFDVLAYVRFTLAPLACAQRSEAARLSGLSGYEAEMRDFLGYVLDAYVANGIEELSIRKIRDFLRIRYGGTNDAKRTLGTLGEIRSAFVGIQVHLFR